MNSGCLLRTDGLTVADLRNIPSGDDDHINIQKIGVCAVSLESLIDGFLRIFHMRNRRRRRGIADCGQVFCQPPLSGW